MYAFDCRIAYSADCNKTQHHVKPKSYPKYKKIVIGTDTYCFPILDGDIIK